MWNRLRNVALIGILLIAVAGLIRIRPMLEGNSNQPTVSAQDTSTVDKGDVQVTVSTTGQISANQQFALNFAGNGKVSKILVNEGDHVLKGQTIAVLDQTDAMDSLL